MLIIESDENAIGGKDTMLIETISRVHSWFEETASGRAATVPNIAKQEDADESDASRMMSFAFLAPGIVDAIVEGRQPVELTAEPLNRSGCLPLPWSDRRRLLNGFDQFRRDQLFGNDASAFSRRRAPVL